MATFVLLHGAGGRGADWRLVTPHLRDAGHDVVAVDLPCDRPVGLAAYTDVVLEAIGERREDVVVVAHSLAGLVAPLVAARTPVALVVLVAAMVPRPGERGDEWWQVTGHDAALAAQGIADDSPDALFAQDVPAEVLAASPPPRDQTGTLFEEPWPLERWPDVPTRALVARDDRFFPVGWLSALVQERLGIEPEVVPGGHCPHLAQPEALAEALLRAWDDRCRGRVLRPAASPPS